MNLKHATIYRLTALLWFAACLWLLPVNCFGQTSTDKIEDKIECGLIDLETIFVQFEIRDRLGRPILNLKRGDILLFEDDVKQYIESLEESSIGGLGNRRIIYKVSYYPTNDKHDGSFRSIKVKLREKVNSELKDWSFETGYRARTVK
jgi:hypothetical protein